MGEGWQARVLRSAATLVFYGSARIISMVLPSRLWYPAILRLSRLQAPFLRFLSQLPPYRGDRRALAPLGWLLNTWLFALVRLGRPFPIPVKASGLDVLLQAMDHPRGVLICSSHIPLAYICSRPLVDIRRPPTVVIAGGPAALNGEFAVWGLAQGLPILDPDSNVLVKIRTVLRRGGSVAMLIDTHLDLPYSPNVFRVARALGAQVVFTVAELQPDGSILVEYFSPPDPCCKTDEGVYANLQMLEDRVHRILSGSSGEQSTKTQPQREGRTVATGGTKLSAVSALNPTTPVQTDFPDRKTIDS